MLLSGKCLGMLLAISCMVLSISQPAAAQFKFKKHIKGTLVNDVYTSPERDFEIQAPTLGFDRWISDETATKDGAAMRVTFYDIVGSYYFVSSFPASQDLSPDEVLLLSGTVQDMKLTETDRGREWRVVSTIPGGSNTMEITGSGERRLDLVTASAIFAANGRTYQVSAGYSVTPTAAKEHLIKTTNADLEKFLAGFKTLSGAPADGKTADMSLKRNIRGAYNKDIYTSFLKDYRVHAPRPFRMGMEISDAGDRDTAQVLFMDDLGGFYRVVSISGDNGGTLEGSLRAFKEPIEQHEIQGARGKEFRVINVERKNAEGSVKIAGATPDSKAGIPDLVTANAVFAANGRIYHVVAGAVSFDNSGTQAAGQIAQRRLENFLSGFEALQGGK